MHSLKKNLIFKTTTKVSQISCKDLICYDFMILKFQQMPSEILVQTTHFAKMALQTRVYFPLFIFGMQKLVFQLISLNLDVVLAFALLCFFALFLYHSIEIIYMQFLLYQMLPLCWCISTLKLKLGPWISTSSITTHKTKFYYS